MGNGLPLYLGKESDDQRNFSDQIENGEGQAIPQLLIQLDRHDPLMLRNKNIRGKNHSFYVGVERPGNKGNGQKDYCLPCRSGSIDSK